MIRHIIMWQLYDEAEGYTKEQNAKRVNEQLQDFRHRIPQIRDMQVGLNITSAQHASDVVLIADFVDQDALQQYQNHPVHQAFIRFIEPLRFAKHAVDFIL